MLPAVSFYLHERIWRYRRLKQGRDTETLSRHIAEILCPAIDKALSGRYNFALVNRKKPRELQMCEACYPGKA